MKKFNLGLEKIKFAIAKIKFALPKKEMLKDKKFKKLFPLLDDFDRLKTAPKGYAKDHPHLDLLKNKSFVVSHRFTDADVINKSFVKKVANTCKTLKPLNDFLSEAIA